MANNESLTTPAQLLQRIITTSAGMVLGVVVVWTVASVAELRTDVDVIQSKEYPPRYIKERITTLGEEAKRCQQQIDRLETFHDGIEQQPLRPYSYEHKSSEDYGMR